MVVFAFANTPEGGFFISSSATNMEWSGLPTELEEAVEDVRRKGEEMVQMSTGLNGDWFLCTKSRHVHRPAATRPSSVDIFRLIDHAQYSVHSFFFVPEPTGYICVLHTADGTQSRCAWRSVSTPLAIHLARGVRHVAVGVGGAYVVILNTGAAWWNAVPGSLATMLLEARKRGRNIQTVSLSLVMPEWFFIEFADGAVHYNLPEAWHATIDRHISSSRLAQPESSSRSSTPRTPRDWAPFPPASRPASSIPWSSFSAALDLYSALDLSMAVPPSVALFTNLMPPPSTSKKPEQVQYKLAVQGVLDQSQSTSQADGTNVSPFDGLVMF